jgi:hypothetical protein
MATKEKGGEEENATADTRYLSICIRFCQPRGFRTNRPTFTGVRAVVSSSASRLTAGRLFLALCTGQFKKKVTLSHVYNEVTSEPTITRYTSIVRKAIKVLICYQTNTQCGNPVSHGTRQSDSPFLSRLSPACPCLWFHSGDDALEPHTVRLLSLGVCQGRRPRTTPAK